MTRDDDKNASRRERARAEAFSELVAKVVDGAGSPPALGADDRALAETMVAVRAVMGEPSLSPARTQAIIDDAFAEVRQPRQDPNGIRTRGAENPASDLEAARDRRKRRLVGAAGFVMATCAAAAIVLVFVSRADRVEPAPLVERPIAQTSRRADVLFGEIPSDRAGLASQRMDTIYADRLTGYRALALGGTR